MKETDSMKFGFGIQLGSGEQWQSWIHIDDIANIFLFIAKLNLSGIYNAVAPKNFDSKIFLKKIRETNSRKFIIIKLPSFSKIFIWRKSLFIN